MISFVKMNKEHIPQLVEWVYADHVYPFWISAHGVDRDIVFKKYVKRLDETNIRTYIIQYNKLDIGLIQTYIIDDLGPFKLCNKSMGIDLFIGDDSYVGKGLGSALLQSFIKHYVFSNEDVMNVCIDPEVANEIAIHVYQKVGFQIVDIGYDKYYNMLTCFMRLSRGEFFAK